MKRAVLALLVVLLTFPVYAEMQTMPRLTIPSALTTGMGGHHVAFTDNVFSLLVNPGAITQTRQRSFVNVAATLDSPGMVFEMVDPLFSMFSELRDGEIPSIGDFLKPLGEQGGQISIGLGFPAIPLVSFASVRDGFGIGFWQSFHVNANLNGLNSEFKFMTDAVLPIGFGFRILDIGKHNLDAGVTLTPYIRAIFDVGPMPVLDLIDQIDGIIEDSHIPVIAGGTVSAGLMYRWGNGLRLGAVFNDIYSVGQVIYELTPDGLEHASDDRPAYYIPFTLDLGAAYQIRLGGLLNLTVAASWHNVFNIFNQDDYLNSRNYYLDFSAGAQLTLLNFVHARAGINEMLPSLGAGVSLGPLCIDVSYYGRELGIEPGQFPSATADISIAIRTRPNPANRVWNKRSLIGRFGGPESD